MNPHWTYQAVEAGQDLEKGDIFSPIPEISDILRDVHPHFCDPKYSGFMLLTQSCDLVRRKSQAIKASYLQICVIRPLSQIRDSLFHGIAESLNNGVFSNKDRSRAVDALIKLYNQNESGRGLFFLYRDFDGAGIVEDSVAFLRVSVSLRATHYDALLSGRTGRLNPDFRAKFGWLTGNLYDRPATPDWSDSDEGSREVKKLVELHLEGTKWCPPELFKIAKEANLDLRDAKEEAEAEKKLPPPRIDKVAQQVIQILNQMKAGLDESQKEELKSKIKNSSPIKDQLRE